MAAHINIPVQPPQASTYRHPCGDLLDGGRRRDYIDIAVPLYRASKNGDMKAAKAILHDHGHLVRYAITEKKDTPLHVAAMGYSTKFVRYLLNMMNKDDLELKNQDGNTAFCMASISGNVDMIKIMYKKNQALPTICGSENMMPLYLAAYHGHRNVVAFLYDKSNRMAGTDWTKDRRDGVLLKCIQSNIFDVALRIVEDNEELPDDKYVWDVLQVLAGMPEEFQSNRPIMTNAGHLIALILLALLGLFWPFYLAKLLFAKQRSATLLLRLLWKRILREKPKDVIDEILRGPMKVVQRSPGQKMETYPSQVLFIAAKMNNNKFLGELIREYPDLVWKRNDDGQTIFHVAVAHRHMDICALLYEIGSMMDLITPIQDNQGNNILHLAAMEPEENEYEVGLTPNFQMENEWYKEVERILPPPCRKVKNEAGQTPKHLFIEYHKKLIPEGIKWINDTINVSMVVAALVCTISFSVVYQIPGGFDDDGFPVFFDNKFYIIFLQLDVGSFIMSSTSIILFLIVILSRNSRSDKALLKIWAAAQFLLLMSVYLLVLAFGVSFYVLYRNTVWTFILFGLAIMITASCAGVCISLVIRRLRKVRFKKNTLFRKTKAHVSL